MNTIDKNASLITALIPFGAIVGFGRMANATISKTGTNMVELTRKSLLLVAALASTIAYSSNAIAQSPNIIKQHDKWAAYSYQGASGKVCYILSIPVKKEPADRDHGDIFFMLSRHPGQSGSLEPQFTVGYPFKDASKVSLIIDGKTFSMFTVGSNAWMENPAEEKQVIAAMRAGRDMSVSGFSRRGTNTVYTYSLSGVTASLKEINTCAG